MISIGLVFAVIFAIRISGEGETGGNLGKAKNYEVQKSSRTSAPQKAGKTDHSRGPDELRAAWEMLIPEHGESLFDKQEMKRFLASLSLEETESLARQLLSGESYPKSATARLMGRWGEFEALAAMAFLEEVEVENDYFIHHIYVGWVKTDVAAAFGHLEGPQPSYDDFRTLRPLVGSDRKRRAIWKTLTSLEPDLALSFLFQHSVEIGGEIDPDRVNLTTDDRDSVIDALPADSDWAEIAERFLDREFVSRNPSLWRVVLQIDEDVSYEEDRQYPSENQRAIQIGNGVGYRLFSKWVSNDPQVAIEWYLVHGLPLSKYSDRELITMTALLRSLGPEEERKSIEWLDQQMKGGGFKAEANKIVRSGTYMVSPSWMGLYAQLSSQEDRFEVMKNAVRSRGANLNGIHIFVPPIPLETTKQYLPLFKLSPSQEAEIRKGLDFFEDRK